MGDSAIYETPVEPQGGVAGYVIDQVRGDELPHEFRNLVYSKWMRSLRFGNHFFKLIDSEAYYSSYKVYIDRVLRMPLTHIRFAVLADDRDVVLGFSVVRVNILDYVHVHKDQRRLGIGANLVKGVDTFTHLTKTGMTIWNNKYSSWKFNPFA